jgi:predicted RNA-binding protein YlxR (DUF448 family)
MIQKGPVPFRTCIGCRRKRKKDEMIWFKQNSDGMISQNIKKNLTGRGFYLCPDRICFKKVQTKKRVGRITLDPMMLEALFSDTRISHEMMGLT